MDAQQETQYTPGQVGLPSPEIVYVALEGVLLTTIH